MIIDLLEQSGLISQLASLCSQGKRSYNSNNFSEVLEEAKQEYDLLLRELDISEDRSRICVERTVAKLVGYDEEYVAQRDSCATT